MKKLISKLSAASTNLTVKALTAKERITGILSDQKGENFVESALKILIAVVIGALLLAGLYLLFNGTVLPTLTQKVKDLFNYGG